MLSHQVYLSGVKPAVHYIKTVIRRFVNEEKADKDFSNRIIKRHNTFWKDKNAETVRNTLTNATAPLEQWKDVKNWQRKLSNKYNAREFAKKHNCKVPDLYWKGRNYDTNNFAELPLNYVIRPTSGHSLQCVFLFSNSTNLLDEKTYIKEDIIRILDKALQKDHFTEFLFEEFVRTEDGEYKIPDDYKFYMFNGEIACIQVINRLSCAKGFTAWYDENWVLLSNLTVNYPDGKRQPAPACLPEMIAAAKTLSRAYKIFCRIDFYATDKGAVFGEFTPTPALGKGFTKDGDKLLAAYWAKYCKGMI